MIDTIMSGRMHHIVYIDEGTGNALSFRQLAEKLRAKGGIASRLRGKEPTAKDSPNKWKNLLAVMKRTCDVGITLTSRNQAVCKLFRGAEKGLGEFKAKGVRAMFFEDARNTGRIVITHCFFKKKDETDPNECNRARRLEAAYYAWLDDQADTQPN